MKERFLIEISWASLWRVFIFSVFVLILYSASDVLVVLSLAIIFSSAFDPFVSLLERKGLHRIIGTLITFFFIFVLVGSVIYVMIPIFVSEFSNLVEDVNKITSELFGLGISKNVLEQLNLSFENVFKLVTSGGITFFDLATNFIGNAALTVVGIIITFYLTIQKNGVENFLRAILPYWQEELVLRIFQSTKRKIGRWLQAQIFLGLVIGIAVFLAMWFLGVKYSLALGFIAMILEIFPVVGPLLAGATATFVALSDSALLAVYTILTFVVIQQLEATLLVPTFMSRAVGLNSIAVLIALMIGGQVAGFLGLILAVPAAVLFQELIENWARQKARQPNLEV